MIETLHFSGWRGCLAIAACTLFLALPMAVRAADTVSEKKEKVVFQVSDADAKKWNLTLNNAKNVQAAIGPDKTEIEIVAYGPGIGMLAADSAVGSRIGEALASGVKVVACQNTMNAMKLKPEDMLKGIGYVEAGVVELMKKQQEGYAYIRP